MNNLDEKWINENLEDEPSKEPLPWEKNMENKTEYKFSWTKKVGEDYHKVSGDTIEEVKKNMQELESMIISLTAPTPVTTQPTTNLAPANFSSPSPTHYSCNICGSEI